MIEPPELTSNELIILRAFADYFERSSEPVEISVDGPLPEWLHNATIGNPDWIPEDDNI